MSNSMRNAYGETITKLAVKNNKIVVFDADLANATKTNVFKEKFKDRFYDFGIAEANMMCAAAAFSHEGLMPFVSTFAIFGTGRAYEQIRNSICYENCNVKLVFTHAGLSVGEDGGSHQSIEDIALMNVLPNMKIIAPCDAISTEKAIETALKIDGPVYIRLSRPDILDVTTKETPFIFGKANILEDGNDIAIITYGLMVSVALEARKELQKQNISVRVVDMHTIKPIDEDMIIDCSKKCKAILTLEEHSIIGGLSSIVANIIAKKAHIKFDMIGIKDKFGHSGNADLLLKEYGLCKENVTKVAINLLK